VLALGQRAQALVGGGPPPQHPPAALDALELGTVAGPSGALQMRPLSARLRDAGAPRPGGVVAHAPQAGRGRRGIRPRARPPGPRHARGQGALPRAARRGLRRWPAPVDQPGGPLAGHAVAGADESPQGVALQVAHHRPGPLAPQGGPPPGEPRAAGLIVAPQDEGSPGRLVGRAWRSRRAMACCAGAALRAREVGRSGRTPWRAQKARLGLARTVRPWRRDRGVASATEVLAATGACVPPSAPPERRGARVAGAAQ
jgi:hypothetical protein